MPELYFHIKRPMRVHIRGFDLDGREVSIEAEELEATLYQHELDHLEGHLLLDLLDQRPAARWRCESCGGGPKSTTAGGGFPAVKLAFLGTPEVAAGTLRAMVEAGHDVRVVVTSPDTRRGRGPRGEPERRQAGGGGARVAGCPPVRPTSSVREPS